MFTPYTNDFECNYSSCSITKYAVDSAALGEIIRNNSIEHLAQVSDFITWCQSDYLDQNVKKKKEN